MENNKINNKNLKNNNTYIIQLLILNFIRNNHNLKKFDIYLIDLIFKFIKFPLCLYNITIYNNSCANINNFIKYTHNSIFYKNKNEAIKKYKSKCYQKINLYKKNLTYKYDTITLYKILINYEYMFEYKKNEYKCINFKNFTGLNLPYLMKYCSNANSKNGYRINDSFNNHIINNSYNKKNKLYEILLQKKNEYVYIVFEDILFSFYLTKYKYYGDYVINYMNTNINIKK